MNKKPRVVITGGSRGIGASIAIAFAKAGCDIAIGYQVGEAEVNEIVLACQTLNVDAFAFKGDLSSREDIEKIKADVLRKWNSVDILVNNGAVSHYGMFQDISWEEMAAVVDTNIKGTVMMTRAFVETMVSQRFGRIINISSLWGVYGGSFEVLYSLSKGAINAFTQALAKELDGTGVTVNAIAPGAVQTRMMDELNEEDLSIVKTEIPLGRLAQPDEIASLALHLSKKESTIINGQILLIHGAWHQ